MRRLIALLLAGAPWCALAAQRPAAEPVVRVSGVVRDTGFSPLDRVKVTLAGRPGRVAYTNARGRFDLDSVPVGRQQLTMSRVGFVKMTVEVAVDSTGAGVVDMQLDPVPELRGSLLPGALYGFVMDTLGQPVADATVQLLGRSADVRTDTLGRFLALGLGGTNRRAQQIVRVRKVGLAPQLFMLAVSDSMPTRLDVTLSRPAQDLGTVVVNGTRIPRRLEGFERRRRQGSGYFLTPAQVEQRKPFLLSDLFRGIPGVRVFPNGLGQPTLFGRGGCLMSVVVDGMNMFMDEENAMPLDALMPANEVLSVEVYAGSVGAPSELTRGARSTGCGVAVITTK